MVKDNPYWVTDERGIKMCREHGENRDPTCAICSYSRIEELEQQLAIAHHTIQKLLDVNAYVKEHM